MVDFPQLAHVGTISPGIYKEFPAEKTGSGLLITKTQSGQQTLLTVAVAQKIQGYLIKVIDPSLPQVAPIPVFINDNGTFNAPNLDPGTYQFAITYKDGGLELILGSKMPTIVIGTNGAIVGEMNIALGLVDPYGTVTDASNNLPLSGAHVTLYYADTPRNRANVITPPLGQIESPVPGTPVKSLPLIPGFDPFDNLNPEQITLLDGEYAWMVFDKTDYYVVTTKPGYYSDRSPILSVDGAIVMYNPKLTPIPAPAAVQPGPATPTPTPNPQVDLAVQILSDRAAYAEESIVTFTINYVNKSDVTVKGASVKAQIPQYTDVSDAAGGNITGSDITWTLGDLAPKATGTIIYKVKVKANSLPQAEVKVTNEAVIASTEALINPEDDKSPLSILLFTSRFGDQGHERYIKGYPDGNFKPNRAITRAEIAAIFSRIMNLQSTVTGEKFYNDISRTFWAKEYIETATRVGLFTGYADGGFKPDAPITRAELSTVIFRYLKLTDRTPIKLDFTDIETHWAKNAIEEIFRYHIITGYPDKTFRPGADMIRTEAVTMINRLLNRGPLYGAEVSFPDVNATHWAFGQVEESAITHDVDPTDAGGQFYDRGESYGTAIYYHSEAQRAAAEASKKALADSGRFSKPIVTPILAAMTFYPAEDYHQDYHKKNTSHYKAYRHGSGRDRFIESHWNSEKDKEILKKKLTRIQYEVTQNNGTEPAFHNEFWDHKQAGVYVDIVSGAPLFTSLDKFDSGCGWPSFTKPMIPETIEEKVDRTHGMKRVEVRSTDSDSHLGHVFNDGPAQTGGLRYCINSAALRFVPKEELEKEGLGSYLPLFN
ncbi:unnamed protein product [Aphanomyces euteiches]